MQFWIAAVRLDMRLPFAASLKDRRHVVRSITDGVRGRFSISAADLGPYGTHGEASLGFAAAGSSPHELEERMGNLEKFLYQREEDGEFEITGFSLEVFSYGDISDRQA
ncbi:DUF503 domain-containing protein [Cloacibacillus sp. An23]|uniref:DUF503 domain-containing protein n=1 Tax=Cloacibacillus sp. An23 TaxID=1965591 RepID=UPI000B38BCE2|nr:DUF503 domain-containing protein [Cloacibacillus sp. An23]OUO93064.1 hypothetical protein B5F39_09465 [Cloacibacillus sp. An23]